MPCHEAREFATAEQAERFLNAIAKVRDDFGVDSRRELPSR